MSPLEIQPFTLENIDDAVRLTSQQGWPHRAEDWALIASVSHGFVARAGDRIVGTGFYTPFGDGVANVNMIIVDEVMRGRGIGRRLVERVIAEADGRSLRLVATPSGLPLYAKLGFVPDGQIVQHQGITTSVAEPDGVENARGADWQAIAELDRIAFGADRRSLFEGLREVGEAIVLRDRGQLTGFAVCRPFGRGAVVGPVVAKNQDAAKRLIAAHLHRQAGTEVRVDTPAENGLGEWLIRLGLVEAGGGVAMTLQRSPRSPEPLSADKPKTFALAAQALG